MKHNVWYHIEDQYETNQRHLYYYFCPALSSSLSAQLSPPVGRTDGRGFESQFLKISKIEKTGYIYE